MDVMTHLGRGLKLVLSFMLCATSLSAQSPADVTPPNPFGDFDSFRLGNGLKVWYGRLPGSTVTSIGVIVPAGSDDDPPGKEQTAHFLEHVLFSDRAGRLEAELARELTALGGTFNGATSPDRTYYWLDIGTHEAAYGVRWLYDVIAPRALSDRLVERNREPVAIEVGARPRQLHDRIAALYLDHPLLRPRTFWAREFGLQTRLERDVDTYAALQSIRAHDLRTFYDTHYAPTEMTLVIVSGAPRALLQPVLGETFGMAPWRPANARDPTLTLRAGASSRFTWGARRNTTLRVNYRIPGLTGQDQLRLMLIAGLLENRLMERLRRGDSKAIYSIGVGLNMRGPATTLAINARLNPAQERMVRDAIDEEIARIAKAASDEHFYRDRDAFARELFTLYASPDALRNLAAFQFYRPELHDEFPDVGGYVTTAGPDSIAAFAARVFDPEQRILRLWRPLPVSPPWLVLLGIGIIWLAVRVYRSIVFRPADMNAIRFVARLRPPARALTATLAVIVALIGLRLVAAAAHGAAEYWLLGIDSFALHAGAAATLLFLLTLAAMAAAGHTRHKVLVFEHELRIKSRTYRSVVIPGADVRAVDLDAPPSGPGRPSYVRRGKGAVVVRLADGAVRRLHVRQPEALLAAVRNLIRNASAGDQPGEVLASLAPQSS
jgi:predicted Zn-dependent peptidase